MILYTIITQLILSITNKPMNKIPMIEYTPPVTDFYTEFTNKALSNLFMIEFPIITTAIELL